MSINATALYPWLQTPTVEKFPPENKVILTAYTDITVTGTTTDFTIFDSAAIGGFTNGGILVDFTLFRSSVGPNTNVSALNFWGYKTNLNGGGIVNHLIPSLLPTTGTIPDASGSGQFGQMDQNMLQQFFGIRFTNSLTVQLRLDRSGDNFVLVCMAKYYKL